MPGHEVVGERARDGTGLCLNLYLDQKLEVKSQLGLEQLRLTATTTGIWLQGTSSQVYKPVLVQALGVAGRGVRRHHSQLHPVADDLSDEAVMIEPTAAGVHAVLRAMSPRVAPSPSSGGDDGSHRHSGLNTQVDAIVVAARYPHQHKAPACPRSHRCTRRARAGDPRVSRHPSDWIDSGPGVDVTIDAVGSSSSLTDAIAFTRPRGRVVVLGMPNQVDMNLTALW